MPFQFCPQCGTKLQPKFKFCPSCGEKLPCSADETGSAASTVKKEATAVTSPVSTDKDSLASIAVSPRPALRKTRNSLRLDKVVKTSVIDASTQPAGHEKTEEAQTVDSKQLTAADKGPSAEVKSPPTKAVSGKAKLSSPTKTQAEEESTETLTVSSPASKSPSKAGGRNRAKKAKHAWTVEPLQEGEEVTDTTGKKWKLLKLVSQSAAELLYEVLRPNSKESEHILKLGAKDGKIFNEQNFLQRAAKPTSVEKWIKQNRMDFLGIPSCVGFGLHADSYRFLIFPNMGQTLHSLIEAEHESLSEKTVLHLACRILDVLEFIHSHEYVHANVNAENIYIKLGQKSQVFVAGYCHAFRYRPGGRHVEYREGSRSPHEGSVEFISLDAHKGAGPSRRGDLQSLAYCMLHWHTGPLPWSEVAQPEQVAAQKQRFMGDVEGLLRHCFGKKKVPSAFLSYVSAVMALQYSEDPKYSELKAAVRDALEQQGGSLELPLSL